VQRKISEVPVGIRNQLTERRDELDACNCFFAESLVSSQPVGRSEKRLDYRLDISFIFQELNKK
jgi:hypothetical protein